MNININNHLEGCHLQKFKKGDVDFLSILLMQENINSFQSMSIKQWKVALDNTKKKNDYFFIKVYNTHRQNFPNAILLAFLTFFNNPIYIQRCMNNNKDQNKCYATLFHWIDQLYLRWNHHLSYQFYIPLYKNPPLMIDPNSPFNFSPKEIQQLQKAKNFTLDQLFDSISSSLLKMDFIDEHQKAVHKKYISIFKSFFDVKRKDGGMTRLIDGISSIVQNVSPSTQTKISFPQKMSIERFAMVSLAKIFSPLASHFMSKSKKNKTNTFVKTMMPIKSVASGNQLPFNDVIEVVTSMFMKMSALQMNDFMVGIISEIPKIPDFQTVTNSIMEWLAISFPALSVVQPVVSLVSTFVAPVWNKFFSHYTELILLKVNSTIKSFSLLTKSEEVIRRVFGSLTSVFVYAGKLIYWYYIFTVGWNIKLIKWIVPYIPTIIKFI